MKWLKLFENFNEKKFIWIHGLPGSGKSFLAAQKRDNDADLDLCCTVKSKVFVQGKGFFSQLIVEIRKKLNLQCITTETYDFPH